VPTARPASARAGGRAAQAAFGGALGRGGRRIAVALAVGAFAAAWAWAAHALWRSSVPAGLNPPHLHASRYFSASFLSRSSSFERFQDIDGLLATLTLLGVLSLYARRGHRLMGESAAGRIGTGMLLGMLGFALVWLAEFPFGLAAVWWQRRHHISHQGYVTWAIDSFLSLGASFLFVSLALLVAMGLAGVLRRWWWAVAAPAFVGLALLSTFLSIYLIPNVGPLRNRAIAADVAALARAEDVPGTKVVVQKVARYTTAPNAESVGFGPTRRVILWDTLLNGRFSRKQVDFVAAHELGHIAHHHQLKRVGWLALFLIPASALIALLTRRRGGLARPEAVPVALLVYVALQLAALPLWNVVSRREETEADWSALKATREPATGRALFERLATTSLDDPAPPAWSYVLYADHPTLMQRIAIVEAFARRPADYNPRSR